MRRLPCGERRLHSEDDLPGVLDALRKTDAIVLASLVYCFSVTTQLKLALDRTYALPRVGTPFKKAALLITCGDDTIEAAEGTVVTHKSRCSYSKWEDAGVVIAPGLHESNDIDGRGGLDKARALGREI